MVSDVHADSWVHQYFLYFVIYEVWFYRNFKTWYDYVAHISNRSIFDVSPGQQYDMMLKKEEKKFQYTLCVFTGLTRM